MSTRREWLKLAVWLAGGTVALRGCGVIGGGRRAPSDAERKAFPEAGEKTVRRPDADTEPRRPDWAGADTDRPMAAVAVKASAMAQPDPVYAAYSVANFMRTLLNRGFGLDDIADHTKALFQLDVYVGQVNNGGHGQYVENTQLPEPTVRYCRQALAAVGAEPYLAAYDRLLALAGRPDQSGNFRNGAFGATAEMKTLDETYFALQRADPLGGYVKRYLAQQRWFHVVPDADYPGIVAWLVRQR